MSIKEILRDQENKEGVRIIGSFLVALSGLILFSDKVFSFELKNNFGFKKTSTFIWVISQTLSPILLLLASVFKPYKTSYLIPVYIYAIQLYWIFQPNVLIDNIYLHTYAIGSCFAFVLLIYVIYKINGLKLKKQKEEELFRIEVNKTIDLLKKEVLVK